MFERQDYLDYFKEIKTVEEEMETKALALSRHFSNPRIKELLHKLVEDEMRHARIVNELISLAEEESVQN